MFQSHASRHDAAKAIVRQIAARHNSRERMSLLDAFKLRRAIVESRTRWSRIGLAELFVEEIMGSSRKRARGLVESEHELAGFESNEARMHQIMCFANPVNGAPILPTSTSIQRLRSRFDSAHDREQLAEQIAERISYQTFSDVLFRAYSATFTAIHGLALFTFGLFIFETFPRFFNNSISTAENTVNLLIAAGLFLGLRKIHAFKKSSFFKTIDCIASDETSKAKCARCRYLKPLKPVAVVSPETFQAQVRLVEKVAARYNSGKRMRLLDLLRLNRAFEFAGTPKNRFELVKTFAQGVRERSAKLAEKLVAQAAETGLSQPKLTGILGDRIRDLFDGRKYHAMLVVEAAYAQEDECHCNAAERVVKDTRTLEGKQRVAQQITDKLSYQTLANAFSKLYNTGRFAAVASIGLIGGIASSFTNSSIMAILVICLVSLTAYLRTEKKLGEKHVELTNWASAPSIQVFTNNPHLKI